MVGSGRIDQHNTRHVFIILYGKKNISLFLLDEYLIYRIKPMKRILCNSTIPFHSRMIESVEDLYLLPGSSMPYGKPLSLCLQDSPSNLAAITFPNFLLIKPFQ